jgi:uncharacterized membrane protein
MLGMSAIVVLGYRDRPTAMAAMNELVALQTRGALKLDDAVLVERDTKGRVHVEQSTGHEFGKRTGTGAILGGVVGALFFVPVAGIAAGAVAGVASALRDHGLDDDFVERTGKTLTPGSAALFLDVAKVERARVIAAIKHFDALVIETSLTPEAEAMLRVQIEDI